MIEIFLSDVTFNLWDQLSVDNTLSIIAYLFTIKFINYVIWFKCWSVLSVFFIVIFCLKRFVFISHWWKKKNVRYVLALMKGEVVQYYLLYIIRNIYVFILLGCQDM